MVTEPMTDADIARTRDEHTVERSDGNCLRCNRPMPCPVLRAIDTLTARLAASPEVCDLSTQRERGCATTRYHRLIGDRVFHVEEGGDIDRALGPIFG